MKSLIANSKFNFKRIKNKYEKSLSQNLYSGEVDHSILSQLNKDGVVVIPNFLESDTVDAILSECQTALNEIQANKYTQTKHHYFPDFGVYRVLECDTISKTSKQFFENPMINNIAKAYVSKSCSSYQRMIEIRPEPGKVSTADAYHFDDWKHRFKAFVYLVDVTEKNAPFVYIKGSHKSGKWREKREYEYFKDGRIGTYGSFFKQEVEHIKKSEGFEEIMCTGSKGTLILTDTKGLHKGTPVLDGKRIHLANYFR